MLVGTYQGFHLVSHGDIEEIKEIYDNTPDEEKDEYLRSIEYQLKDRRSGASDLGFDPVWFFPMPTLADAFAQSALISTFKPLYLFVYDLPEEEMIKLDAVRHELGDYKKVEDLITDTDDLSIVEYVVDNKVLDNYTPKLVFPLLGMASISETPVFVDYGILKMQERLLKYYFEFNESIIKAFNDFLESNSYYPCNMVDGTYSGDERALSYMAGLQVIKDEFAFTLLPFLYELVKNSGQRDDGGIPYDAGMFLSTSKDFNRFLTLRKKYAELANSEELTHESYKAIYDKMKEFVCEDLDVLEELWYEGEPRRNDLCPCGSGKKWKRCHGRYHHKVR